MIELPQTITVEPTPAKTFTGIWIKSININSPMPGELARANIMVTPYNSTTGELYDQGTKMIMIDDVFASCATNETLNAAMTSIFAAVQHLITERNTFGE